MQKTCVNGWCKAPFEVTDDDLAFYDKVSPVFGGKKYLVPPPTQCPECRARRRLTLRNERRIYMRACDLCKKNTISGYHPESPYQVYCTTCFHGNGWDPMASGRDFDFNRPFFEQFQELALRAPKIAKDVGNTGMENSEYVNHVDYVKNCYLVFASAHDRDCLFGHYMGHSSDVVDGLRIYESELCYECVDCRKCYGLKFSQSCDGCTNCQFLYNCRGCTDCILCTNLVQKQYCILNEQYSREEYEARLREFHTQSFGGLLALQKQFDDLKQTTVRKCTEGYGNIDSLGNVLTNCKQCTWCFDLADCEDCTYVSYGNKAKDCMDTYAAYAGSELVYESVASGDPTYSALFCYLPWQGSNLLYCTKSFPVKDCFGCNSMRNVRYCVLNKQYTKQEYDALVPKIIEHMQKTKEWGEYFPASRSTFGYNETAAQEYFPLKREEALERGFVWSEYEAPPPEAKKIIRAQDLPDSLEDTPDDILSWAIQCALTQKPFKIIRQELDFYRKMKLPIPRFHPEERHKRRMALRNPRKLWNRECDKCQKPIATSYSPERPEIVYCEECYLKEVY